MIKQGKLILGKDNSLTILYKDDLYEDFYKNVIIYKDILNICLEGSSEFEDYMDLRTQEKEEFLPLGFLSKPAFDSLQKNNLISNLDYCRDVNTYTTDMGDLNLIKGNGFLQLTLDSNNQDIINSYADLNFYVLKSMEEYHSFCDKIQKIAYLLDSKLDTDISKVCIYNDKSNPELIFFALYDENSKSNIFVNYNFLSLISDDLSHDLELNFKEKLIGRMSPLEGDENNDIYIKAQQKIILKSIIDELKRVSEDDSIFIDTQVLVKITQASFKILEATTNPTVLIVGLALEDTYDLAVKGFAKSLEKLSGISSDFYETIQNFHEKGPMDVFVDKTTNFKARISRNKNKQKDDNSDEL